MVKALLQSVVVSLTVLTFQMTVAPDASEQELAYAEKWRYIIQLRYVWVSLCSVSGIVEHVLQCYVCNLDSCKLPRLSSLVIFFIYG